MEPLPLHDSQELSRQFNEDEAVWRCFEEKRSLRRLRPLPSPFAKETFPAETLDRLDWLEAERETRTTRAISRWIDP